MPILVGQENIYDMVYGGLVYAQVRSHILHKQVPVLCMILLWPSSEITQMILVIALQIIAIYVVSPALWAYGHG